MAASKAPRRNRSKKDDPAYEKTRAKIKTTQIVNHLQHHILGEKKRKSDKNAVELSPSQVTAALGLLKKCLPDLQSTELTTGNGQPLVPTINITTETKK